MRVALTPVDIRPFSRMPSSSRSVSRASFESFHALCQSMSVEAVAPAPITSRMYSALSSRCQRKERCRNIKNVRVGVLRARIAALLLEVPKELGRVVADITEVDRLPALAEEQEPIKYLEQLGRRLVDRAEDSLAVIRKLTKEADNSPSALRVETGCGFVEEEEEFRLWITISIGG